jgi:hypothetical protein
MESKISEANSHDEIFISVGDILIMAISSVNIFFKVSAHPLCPVCAAKGERQLKRVHQK